MNEITPWWNKVNCKGNPKNQQSQVLKVPICYKIKDSVEKPKQMDFHSLLLMISTNPSTIDNNLPRAILVLSSTIMYGQLSAFEHV